MFFPKALIFDVDGTLADNERDGHRVAFNLAFAAAGLDWAWSESHYGELLKVGGGKERIHCYIQSERPRLPAECGIDLDKLDDPNILANLKRFVKTLHLRKIEFYQQLIEDGEIPLRPGVLRLLNECRQNGVRLAIATTSALPSALALIDTIAPGARDWFEVIAAGDIVSAKKPAPDIYQYALQQLDLPASDCIAIEDSRPGCAAAVAAGITPVVTVNDYTRAEHFASAALVVNHLGMPDQPFRILDGELAALAQSFQLVNLELLSKL